MHSRTTLCARQRSTVPSRSHCQPLVHGQPLTLRSASVIRLRAAAHKETTNHDAVQLSRGADGVQNDSKQQPLQELVDSWARQAAAAVASVAFTATTLLTPVTSLPPPAAAEAMREMHHSDIAGKASSRFQCTPLTPAERITHFNLSGFHHKINTRSPEAQALFNQGLLLAYNFNHPEALKSFQEGLKYDPDAAMLHWGITYALSPYANVVWGPGSPDDSFPVVMPHEVEMAKQAAKAGLAAAQAAAAAAAAGPNSSSSSDSRLIQAELGYLTAADKLWRDIKDNADPAWTPALEQYAKDLEAVAAAHPDDADAAALAGEARMTLNPWVYWSGPWSHRVAVDPDRVVNPAFTNINTAAARAPGHPLAAHLLIHLTEAATPGSSRDVPVEPGYAAAGEPGADLLSGKGRPAFPGMGHLTHMPSHIYLRVGRWHDGVVSNLQALAADEADAKRCVEPYMPTHNANLLLYSAMMSGELREAAALTQKMVRYPEIFGPNNMSDGRERSTLPLVYARFGKWDPILSIPPDAHDYSNDGVMTPPGTQQFGDAVYHYTRALAFASKAAHETDASLKSQYADQMQSEFTSLQQAVAATPEDPFTRPGDGIGIYSPGFKHLGQIQVHTVAARGAVLSGDLTSAADHLQQALAIDDSFGYTEPPRQPQPVKPCLAWVMMQQGRLEEAEQVYLDDLLNLPRNPWSLKGLQQVYQRQGTPEAKKKLKKVEADLKESWQHADKDLQLNSSCPAFTD